MLGTILAGLVGLTIGSVLNVIITRLPQEEPFWGGRPPCFQCQRTPPWYDLVPLLSYAWLKGQCRFCRASISWRYPAVELAAGLLALALWVRFPGSLFLLLYGPFTAALVVLTVLDVQYYWLPDAITLPGIAFGLTAALILPQVSFVYALLGALGGWALFQVVRWAYEKLTQGGRQGMGGGDVKLMAFIGAVLGVEALPWVLFSSAALGSLGALVAAAKSGQGRPTPIPYAPFLAVGAFLFLFWKT